MASFDITKLNQSSFRGVPFFTKATDLSGGKRISTHNFINGGNKAEDNGLSNDSFKITGYLGGENYLDERDNLINANKTPSKIPTTSVTANNIAPIIIAFFQPNLQNILLSIVSTANDTGRL